MLENLLGRLAGLMITVILLVVAMDRSSPSSAQVQQDVRQYVESARAAFKERNYAGFTGGTIDDKGRLAAEEKLRDPIVLKLKLRQPAVRRIVLKNCSTSAADYADPAIIADLIGANPPDPRHLRR